MRKKSSPGSTYFPKPETSGNRKNRLISFFPIDKITLYEKVIFSCKINYNL